ncbi:MAG: NAD-dependent epimerase/dehydratase family protein, partial [Gammaproteobacteria bacterium]
WLITGGCGFIGRSLIARLLAAGTPAGHIRVFDNLSVGTLDDLRGVVAVAEGPASWAADAAGCEVVVGDIREREAIARAAQGADVIVHLAACTGVQPSVEDPLFDCETNVTGTVNGLEAARAAGVKRFVFASSGAPLGAVQPPIHEEVMPRPISPYGASKLAGEGYCSAYYACFGVETVALRFGNVYGPLSSRKNSVVARFIKQALAGETLEIYGDGSATRDYIFAGDLTGAIIDAATVAGVGGEIFQIATSRETTVDELAERLRGVLAGFGVDDFKVVHGAARAGDMQRNYSDTTKARERLGWQAATSLDEGLQATVAWFLERDASKA